MKKFNLFKEIITVDKSALLNAINSSKIFAIDIYGEIKEAPFNNKEILIYQGQPEKVHKIENALGKNYQLVEDRDRVLIKAFANWQELIGLNTPRASYDDTTADGVAEFSSSALEDIGWHATEFNISYRALVEVLEERCEGIMYCIEQEDPYQFSGLGFLSDDAEAKEVLFKYCQEHIKELLENDPDFKRDELTSDELEAAEFFNL
ncbi:hypothetical protein M947_03795 [Sulfurimonas hongkongensis]|uniref:Uncharacterized protein n=1 Tax=Sulfurimonas hongkongensis TaxID=1172190 RepID=T0JTA0_9BACT|nr:hypothetical protein [Sulfurimonas hongkongensis]EQB40157.1 hypothetical protein M947_03795 [Sulfurimonas hongkongensis]